MPDTPSDARSTGPRRRQKIEAAAVCAPGTEEICRAELTALGIRSRTPGPGIVEFTPTTRQFYASLVWLRTATRVLVRLGTFRATTFEYLELRAAEIDWDPWLVDGARVGFRVSSTKSRLIHTDAIAQRLERVLGRHRSGTFDPADHRRHRADDDVAGDPSEEADITFVVRADRDRFTVSIDVSGSGFHRRSWREDRLKAPLRPNLAAAAVLAAKATAAEQGAGLEMGSLIDPFCGSGTLLIEAALIARGLPPDLGRVDWLANSPLAATTQFERGTWASVVGEVVTAVENAEPISLEASDRDDSAVAATLANADRAGVADGLRAETRVVSHLPSAPGQGLILANPPYGVRLDQGSLEPLYRRFGAVSRERRSGNAMVVVCPDRKLARLIDGRLRPVAGFGHGGRSVGVFYRPRSVSGPGSDSGPGSGPSPDSAE